MGLSSSPSAPGGDTAVVTESEYQEEGRAWAFTYNAVSKQYESPYALSGSGETYEGYFGESASVSESGEEILIGGGSTDALLGAAWAFGNEAATAPTVRSESGDVPRRNGSDGKRDREAQRLGDHDM